MNDDERRPERSPDARVRRLAAPRGPRSWSLATQLFAFQAAVILVVLLGTGLAAFSNASTANSDAAQDEVLGVARTLAAAPVVTSGALGARPDLGAPAAGRAGPPGHRYRLRRGHDARRHPVQPSRPTQIGGRFRGTIAPAVAGGTVVETFTGTLGPSVRAVVPVVVAGRVAGLVAVGRTINHVSAEMTRQLPLLRAPRPSRCWSPAPGRGWPAAGCGARRTISGRPS